MNFRSISTSVWNDAKFLDASDDIQLLWFHLRTTPFSNPLGCYKIPLAGLAAEKRWPLRRYRQTFAKGLREGFWKVDERFHVVFFPKHFKYNKPSNPNVLLSWLKFLDAIPNCPLKAELINTLKTFAEGWGEGFVKVTAKLPETFGEGSPNRDRDSNRDSLLKNGGNTSPPGQPWPVYSYPIIKSKTNPEAISYKPAGHFIQTLAVAYPGVDLEAEMKAARLWLDTHRKRWKTFDGMPAFLNSWMKKAFKDLKTKPKADTVGEPEALTEPVVPGKLSKTQQSIKNQILAKLPGNQTEQDKETVAALERIEAGEMD